jgi:3-hydroxybutyryl-CoA dehydrogenase
VIPLVEVTSTAFTSPDVFERTFSILEGVGKKPVRVLKDVPGFIGSRLQFSLWREAIEMVEAGICDAETIDIVVKNSFGMKLAVLGPMENVDLVGLELTRDVHRNLFPYLSKSDKPSPLLDKLIEQGKLGMASGEGLRKWTEKEAQDVRTRLAQLLIQRK